MEISQMLAMEPAEINGNKSEKEIPQEAAELFAGALSLAQQQTQQQPQQKIVSGNSENGAGGQVQVAVATPEQPVQAKAAQVTTPVVPQQSLLSKALGQKKADGMNAVVANAGPTPWDKNWVFRGNESANPELKTLFGEPKQEPQAAPQSLGQPALQKMELPAGSDAIPADVLAKLAKPVQNQAAVAVPQKPAMMTSQMPPQMASQMSSQELAIAQALSALGGDMSQAMGVVETGSESDSAMEIGGPRERRQAVPAQAGATTSLSGSDFLSMLNGGIQGGGQKGQMSGGFGQERQGQQMGQQPHQSGSELKLVGGLAGAARLSKGKMTEETESGLFGGALPNMQHLAHNGAQNSSFGAMIKPAEVNAPVVQGAGAQERLSSEALVGLGTQIRNLGANGGGEIRVRLKPENLGELHLKIVTRGNEVGIQFHASDDRAKRILEESISHLRDGLASQNLSLGRVDFALASGNLGGNLADGGFGQPQQQQHQQQSNAFQGAHNQTFGGMMGDAQNGGGQGSRRFDGGEEFGGRGNTSGAARLRAAPAAMAAAAASRASGSSAGRLNVMA